MANDLLRDLEKLGIMANNEVFPIILQKSQIISDMDMRAFAQFIVNHRTEDQQVDPFWDTLAVSIINIVFYILLTHYDKKYHNLINASVLVYKLNNEKERTKFEEFIADPKTDKIIFTQWKNFITSEPKAILCALLTASVSLNYWTENQIATITSQDTIELEKLRKERSILYIITDPQDVEYYQPLLNTFYKSLFRTTLKGFP